MAEFPFDIATLSRFCTPQGAARKSLEGLQAGQRSTSSSARIAWRQHDVEFHNLGLVVIDEEQRFGVEVKERLKALRHDGRRADDDGHADSAHAAHVAARRARHLEPGNAAGRSPGGRDATSRRWDDELIRHAILRELNRGGQIYFVHNRVNDIELVADRLQRDRARGEAASSATARCPRASWSR